MLKDITLGQYFPGNSIIHKVDPRMKLLSTVIIFVGVFMAKSLISYAALLVFAVVLTIIARIPLKTILKSIKAIVFILIFTSLINIFLTKGKGDPLVDFWIFKIYKEGIVFAIMMIVRITVLLITTSVVLTYTTSPIALTDGIEQMFWRFNKLREPVHEFAMMMTIALRFIPTFIDKTDKIMSAQKARGADFNTGGLIKRIKALLPVLIPLFVSAFRLADDLALAMESRCYRGGQGRTKMKSLKYSYYDFIFILVLILFCVAIYFINRFLPVYTF